MTSKHHVALALLALLTMAASQAQAEDAATATRVTLQPLQALAIYSEQSATASALSLNQTVISSELNARVTELLVDVGSRVEKDALLARLDCREATQQAHAATAALELANREALRARTLAEKNNLSQSSLNQADAALKQSRAQSALATLEVERCEIRAPFNGVITERMVSIGHLAAPGTALFELVDTENVDISAQLRSQQTAIFKSAADVEFRTDGQTFKVQPRVVSPVIDAVSRTVEARLSPIDAIPKPGSQGRIQWRLQTPALPSTLIQERDGDLGYFVAENGHAKFIPLPNATRGEPAILGTLPTLPVIITGRFGLRDGDPIVEAGE